MYVNAITGARSNGARVRIILDQDQWLTGSSKDKRSAVESCRLIGCLLKLRKPKRHATLTKFAAQHEKSILIDAMLVVGSHNLTYNSADTCEEVGVFLREEKAVERADEHFEVLWQDASEDFDIVVA